MFKKIFSWIFRRDRRGSTPPQIQVPSLPPETNIEWEAEEVDFQRLPELPISKGKKAKIEAIVVHYTAGWRNQRAFDAVSFMQRMGHGYLFIDQWGSIWQHINLDEAYAHAGSSVMPSFSPLKGRSGVSSFSIGIEVACGGRIDDKNRTSFGKKVEEDQIRASNFALHGKYGRYEIFTPEQEKALIDGIVHLCRKFNIDPDNVVGHHEISPDRRDDPAAALSMGMHGLRKIVKDQLRRG